MNFNKSAHEPQILLFILIQEKIKMKLISTNITN